MADADAYPHGLLVEFEGNKVPRLKTKLVKYFQSKKSRGGDCTVEHESGSRTAVLRFRTQQDQKNVLEKDSHQILLETGALKLTVRLLPDQDQETSDKDGSKTPDVTVPTKGEPDKNTPGPSPGPRAGGEENEEEGSEEEAASTASLLGNIPVSMNQEFVEMLVENILKKPDEAAPEGVTVEMIPGTKTAVVNFKTGRENRDFLSRCPLNRTFNGKKLSVEPLEPTTQVLIEDSQLNEDVLRMSFENVGADVEDVEINERHQTAVITFTDCKDVQRLLKKTHRYRKRELKLYPFYKSLGRALYGADKPPLRLPPPVSEHIDKTLLRFISSRPSAKKDLQTELHPHFCKTELKQGCVLLSPESELLQQEEDVIKEWTNTVRSVLSKFVSRFKACKLQPPPELMKQSQEQISQLLRDEDLLIFPDETSGVLSVVGPEADISRLQPTLCETINSIIKQARREQLQVTEEIKVPPCVFKLLSQNGIREKLLSVYPELKIEIQSPFPKITGLMDEIVSANKVISNEIFALKHRDLEMDRFMLEFLKNEDQEELTDKLLRGMNAVFELHPTRVQLLACSERDLYDAEEHLKTLFVSKSIKVEDKNVLQKNEWAQLVNRVEKENNKGSKKIQIRTENDQVVVSGFKDGVARVSPELEDFLKQNAQVQESFVIKPVAKLEYIKNFKKSELDEFKDDVQISFTKEAVCLSGSRANTTCCIDLVQDLVDSVAFEAVTVIKHGARKIFEDVDSNYNRLFANEMGCLVKIVNEPSAGQDNPDSRAFPKPVYEIKMSDGVEICVCNADMCCYPVKAVVNASVEDLQLTGGLSAALSKAAGAQLQAECNKINYSQGPLKPGDCVVTNAGGNLICEKIIHAVGPKFEPQSEQKAQAQLKRAVKGSLQLAEEHQCDSLAMPAISRNRGFPLDSCAQTIVRAIREHCEDKFGESCLRRIHLVNNDVAVVQAMEDAVRKEFGDKGTSHGTKTAASVSKPTKTPPTKAAGPDPNCVGKVSTKEGLKISVVKGRLEKSRTDVIVNTATEDLTLSRGAVSNAILKAAGPVLQQMVMAKQNKASVGEVIVTEGCNLSCKQVYHAVAPHWDNGQGTAQKQLSGIFKECLSKAEGSGMSSISFSAIGTGNLGFPKDLVASSILDQILEFSKTQPKHLKKICIVLFSGDGQTLQVFSDEFQKKFPKAGGSSQTALAGGPFSKIVSTSGAHETKLGNVTVQVLTGDITKETTDVIVNSSNSDFSLKSGVSKAILEAAGPAVENECQTLAAQQNDGIILTQPGNLKCKKILHLVGQTDLVKITKVVKDALQTCLRNSLTSVAFPAIGTGQGNVGAKCVADAMLDAVIDVLTKNPTSSLKTVRVVIFQKPMLKDFHDSLQQRSVGDGKDKQESGGVGWALSKLKSLFVSASPEKTQKTGDFVIEALKPAPVCFHICGQSNININAAKQKIDKILSKEHHSNSIKDEVILSLSDEDHQRLVDIQKKLGVGIRVESKNGEACISVEGLTKDVLDASNKIHEMLKMARHEEDLNQKAALVSTVVEWQYQCQGQDFQGFDMKANYELEQALEKKLNQVKVSVNGQEFTVKLPNGPASGKNGQSLKVQRINKMNVEDLPKVWDQMDTSSTKVIAVASGSAEYQEVLQLFQKSCNKTVLKIERVQNPVLWQSLQIKKRAMDVKNGHTKNERRLFHGTCDDTAAHINEHGFNRSYAGKNATYFGKGTYFAVNAQYSSQDTYSRPNPKGEKCMYLCRVLTGDFTTGQQNMIEPPLKTAGSIEKYDSVVDNMQNPTMFIIFHDSHAYPEYLITFT